MDETEDPDSPFLNEALFELEPSHEWKPLADALLAQSPFQTALGPGALAADPRDADDGHLLQRERVVFEGEEIGVISGENRVRITNTTAVPFRWICQIEVKPNRALPNGGTGVLVSNRHVLTAAHVVYEAAQNMQNFSIEVRPALNFGDEPFGSYSVSAKPRLPRHYRPDAADRLDWDYALLKLDTAIGEKTFRRLQGKALCFWGSPACGSNSVFARPDPATLNGKAVFTAGYPRSAGANKLLCAPGFLVGAVPTQRTMRITSDTTQGQSGSPVWIAQDQRYCLVGIAVGASKHLNVVVRVTRELVRQVRTWITEDGDTPTMIETEEPLDSPGVDLAPPEEEDDATERTEDGAVHEQLALRHHESMEAERGRDLDVDFEHLGLLESDIGGAVDSPTLGFEFDLNFGFEPEVATAKSLSPPSGWRWPGEGLPVTDHAWKTSGGDWQDAIQVTLDAVRMEISTAPFHIDDDAEFNRIVKAVLDFGKELVAAPKTRDKHLDVPKFKGHPTTFTHARTVVNQPEVDAHGTELFPGDSEHATYKLSPVPLVIHRVSNEYPTDTRLWASPQATVTLPLSSFGSLVWRIHETKGPAGIGFSGRSGDRLGLRDDLAWLALKRAVADRKKKLGAVLSDGSTVTDAHFTRSITSLVTILVMYMLTSVMKDSRDEARENFAKGSLPLNVKTPLWQIHHFALTDRERFVFRELYGAAAKRSNLYALAKPGATAADGSTRLFPTYTRWDPERFLGTAPTWQMLVEAVVDEKPVIVQIETGVAKKKHRKGDEILIAPLSNKIVWDKTKPRIAVEMRRLGFAPVHFEKWEGLMIALRELARKVNG